MNAQQIQDRRDKLAADYQKNEQAFENCRLMREALHGAIQDCDHWLKVLAAEEETERLAADKPGEWVDVTKKLVEMRKIDEEDAIAQAEAHEAMREAVS